MEKLQHWQKVKQIVGAALEREPADRGGFLDKMCSHDPELRAEVESLLAAHCDSGDLLRNPWMIELTEHEAGPKIIGPYRLLKELGVGGMGQVWLAEQSEPVRRRVALKLIKAGMYDSAMVQRFQSERQSLAMMDHPTIAKVFDAGATPAGQPYFAMEYVDGLPITDYCDWKKLGIRERLKLFLQACEGVQHAHQKAIIHRDLKPSNILVVEIDGKPMPRIIDFGLAKAAVPLVPGETVFTQVGAFLGTPGYMSPEQVDPDVHDIDTRTDVYSLGVVLYELLTGLLPFDTKQWKIQRLEELLRQLRETDPQRPSVKVGTDRDTLTARAAARGTEAGQLVILLRGDLDSITLKALDKERERRYGTPFALATDIERFFQNRPIEARPASTTYRLRKYVRRNRLAVMAAAGVAVLLVAFAVTFAVTQSIELRRITRERDRADRITQFMTGMFKVSDPNEPRGNSITVREILDKASKEIDSELTKDPELQAQMMVVMGQVYANLGLYGQAQTLLTKAVDIRSHLLGPRDISTLRATDRLGWVLSHEGHYIEAEKVHREALGIRRSVLGSQHPETLWTMLNLAWDLNKEGKYDEAEKLEREALEIHRRVLGPEHPSTLLDMQGLASTLHRAGHPLEAEKLQRETMEIQRRILGPENPSTLTSVNNLANTLDAQGRYAEAEQLQRAAFKIQLRVLGPEHPDTLRSMLNLAWSLNREGRYVEAERLGGETLEKQRRALGSENPETLLSMSNLADTLNREGRHADAEKLQREELEIQRRIHGPTHPATAESIYNLACTEAVSGRRDEALRLLREAIDQGLSSTDELNIEKAAELESLHRDPQFVSLVAHAKERAAAAQEFK